MIERFLFNKNKSLRSQFSSKKRTYIINLNPFCVYCNNENINELVIDHINPINLGGKNDFNNLTVCCNSCNSRKWTYPIYYFLENTINKRHKEYTQTIKYINDLRSLLFGKKKHYSHTEFILKSKINKGRKIHSYYTRIIKSIINENYKIF